MSFHATDPLPPEARHLAHDVTAAFVASPLGIPAHRVDIWLVDEGWPARIFFHWQPASVWGTDGRERVWVTRALARLSGDLDALFAPDAEMAGKWGLSDGSAIRHCECRGGGT